MMSEDEPGTLAALQRCRCDIVDPAIARHHGRIVKLIGDGLLAEFSSIVEAVACAAEFQREIAARNAGAANKSPMIFRVGVHLGDVIVEGSDIYGDGVNIAARLEGIAKPGGICISRQAYDHVQKKLALGYNKLGPQKLKNIPDPIEAFSILETVVEAAGFKKFRLFGMSQGCAISIAYAVRHPERVSHLILLGGFALGASKRSPQEAAKREAHVTLTQLEWGANSPTIRQLFATALMPDASKEQTDSFNELQRRSTSAECAARYLKTTAEFDVTNLLPQVRTPTLVMHARGDAQVPLEAGRQMAAGIPGAKFVVLQSNNHILLEQDPATQRFFEEIRLFLGN